MTARDRSRSYTFGPGYTARKIGNSAPVETFPLQDSIADAELYERCQDIGGLPSVDHPLTITRRSNPSTMVLNGTEIQAAGYRTYTNIVPSGMINVAHLSTNPPGVNASATTLLARSNPSKPYVSVPNFLYELKDLPGMYRDIMSFKLRLRNLGSGRGDPRTIANYHLSLSMGFAPLISDLLKLTQFQREVARKNDQLKKLYSGGGLRRRINLYSEVSDSVSGSTSVDTRLGATISVRKSRVTTLKRWGTVRWLPDSIPKDIGHQHLGQVARELVLGIHQRGITAEQAWNALPWSWLADWFGNTGEWLASHSNVIPAHPRNGQVNIMTHTRTTEHWARTDSNDWAVGAFGERVYETKLRSQSSGSLSVTLPYITGRQFSILGALSLQRLKL